MGVKNFVRRIGEKTGDKVAQLSKLSPAQIVDVEAKREEYLLEMPNPDDEVARALTEKMMAASSIEVFNAYLPQLQDLYVPVKKEIEYDGVQFNPEYNIKGLTIIHYDHNDNVTTYQLDYLKSDVERMLAYYKTIRKRELAEEQRKRIEFQLLRNSVYEYGENQ